MNAWMKKVQNVWKKYTQSKAFASLTGSLIAIFIGLMAGFLVMLIAKPSAAFPGLGTLLTDGFLRMGDVLFYATPVLLTGLSVGFAFKMGLFNIGASGQYTMGMYCAMAVGFLVKGLPSALHVVLCLAAGILGGALWGALPGFFKAFLNVNEVITSIMFNYIGMYLVDIMIKNSSTMYNTSTTRTNYIPQSAQLLPLDAGNSSLNIGLILALIIAVALWFVLSKTTFGYELRATGFNKNAALCAGMNSKRNVMLAMVIAGALSGLGGALYVLSPSKILGASMTYEPINVISSYGFNGIAVALLGGSHPIGIIFSAIFISFIQRGGTATAILGFKPEIVDIVIAVTIYLASFSMAIRLAFKKFFKRNKQPTKEAAFRETASAGATKPLPGKEEAERAPEEHAHLEDSGQALEKEKLASEEKGKEEL